VSAYDNDPRVELVGDNVIVNGRWMVLDHDGVWDAYPLINKYAAHDDPVGASALCADEKIRDLIGEPQ
jgi:hypothetical protein